ncbi:septum formation initiator family protein [uncultured Limosilactobacillus sp.]|uniref:FtsB family cell division protein n=1 Tax=uncultured Limosilactobacillus sp. TaxID=2837629 RepID=UPI0025F29541|nr:septum formation initiator family protein [uncultured Limosilactobacillus sp.]
MKNGLKNNITKLNTPFSRQRELEQSSEKSYRYRVHMRRAKVILGVFIVFFLILAIQIIGTKRELGKVNQQTAKANVTLTNRKATNKKLKKQVKKLHNPSYLQELVREKYNYAKDGETIYNFVK